MATIQIRDVPDDVHKTYRQRAASAGMSLQEYLRAELIRNASRRTPEEVVREVRERLQTEGGSGFATGSSVRHIRADRRRH
jgi:plasmid stability protein